MTKLPTLSGKEVVKALSKAGFQPVRQKSSHVIFLLEIIRQSGMTREEFIELVKK